MIHTVQQIRPLMTLARMHDGFEFMGITHDGRAVKCTLCKRLLGATFCTGGAMWHDLQGWVPC